MEKNNQKKKNPQQERVCDKIFKAISISSPIQTIRRISNRFQSPSTFNDHIVKNISIQTNPVAPEPMPKTTAEPVQIKFDYSVPSNTKTKPLVTNMAQPGKPTSHDHGQTGKLASKVEPEPLASVVGKQTKNTLGTKLSVSKAELAKTRVNNHHQNMKSSGGIQMEEHFTNYIKRAKLKIRATTNVGDTEKTDTSDTDEGAPAKKESSKDLFSEYIRRTKMKIRTTSSIGSGSRRDDSFNYVKD